MPYVMHLEVKSAGVADGVTLLIPSPQRCDVGLTVGARRASSACRRLQRHKMRQYRSLYVSSQLS